MARVKLDRIDNRILSDLQDHGRMTNVDLARRAGISAPPCLRRVRALERAGLIRGYHADISPEAMGFTVTVFALVGLSSQAEPDLKLKLARAIARLGPQDWTWEHIDIHDVPLYDQDRDNAMPPQATRLKQRIEAADGLLFVTPEYNRSIPGVLKNAIDTASRPYGKNSFAGKPAGVIGASIGSMPRLRSNSSP